MVAILQFLFKLYVAAVNLSANAFGANLGMYVKSEVKQGGTHRQLSDFPLRSENKHLVGIETRSYFPEEVASLLLNRSQDFAHLCHPCVKAAFAFNSLVAKVSGKTFFGNLIHASCAYLDLHPATGGSHHGGMERLVPVCLWDRNPVAHPARVRLVDVSHN